MSVKINEFSQKCSKLFGEFLKQYGFELIAKNTAEYTDDHLYRKKEQYIQIMATNHWEWEKPYCNIVLGQGEAFALGDTTSIALWRLINKIEGNNLAVVYEFESEEDFESQLKKAFNDLKSYGRDFLEGDLSLFYLVREEQNREIGYIKNDLYKLN